MLRGRPAAGRRVHRLRVVPAPGRGAPRDPVGQPVRTAPGARAAAVAELDRRGGPTDRRRPGLPGPQGLLVQQRLEPVADRGGSRGRRVAAHVVRRHQDRRPGLRLPRGGRRRAARCADLRGRGRAGIQADGPVRVAAPGGRPVDAGGRGHRHLRPGRLRAVDGPPIIGPILCLGLAVGPGGALPHLFPFPPAAREPGRRLRIRPVGRHRRRGTGGLAEPRRAGPRAAQRQRRRAAADRGRHRDADPGRRPGRTGRRAAGAARRRPARARRAGGQGPGGLRPDQGPVADRRAAPPARPGTSWRYRCAPATATRGFLEVRDRRSRWGRYRAEDLVLLETLGSHVATAHRQLRPAARPCGTRPTTTRSPGC